MIKMVTYNLITVLCIAYGLYFAPAFLEQCIHVEEKP